MSLLNPKRDRYGHELKPGDACALSRRDKVELAIYKGPAYGGKRSGGEYGRFVTLTGRRTLKFTSVVFVFDPMSARRHRSANTKKLMKMYYE